MNKQQDTNGAHRVLGQLQSMARRYRLDHVATLSTANFVVALNEQSILAAIVTKELGFITDRLSSNPDETGAILDAALKRNSPMEAAKKMAETSSSDAFQALVLKLRVDACFRITEEITTCQNLLEQQCD